MECDFNTFYITDICFLVFLLIILQEITVVSVLHNFGLHGDQNYAVVHFNIFRAHVYHGAAHSNDPYVCSYTIWIWLLICHIKHTFFFSFSCQSDITSNFQIVTMYKLVDSQKSLYIMCSHVYVLHLFQISMPCSYGSSGITVKPKATKQNFCHDHVNPI